MANRIRGLEAALRRAHQREVELVSELADARISCGTTHLEVARALGWSPAKVRRIEGSRRVSVTYLELASLAAVVGLKFHGGLYPGPGRLRDEAQLEMINRYREMATGAGWRCRIEDPLPAPGDLRAFDLVLVGPGARVAHEFLSRLRDAQAQVRPLLQKQRDGQVDGLILVIKGGEANRRAVAEAGAALRDLFPLSTRAVLSAIRQRRDPGANGIVFW